MNGLTELQRRILTAALVGQGRIMLWILKDGRHSLPGFSEDVGPAIKTLEGAGLLHCPQSPGAGRGPGSWVFRITDAGLRAAREFLGRSDGFA